MPDSQGNDITAVAVPVTGYMGFAPAGTPLPTPTEGKDPLLALDAPWKKAGLLKDDGGFEWTLEADGDPITFWQEGYSIPSGLANATLAATLAETSANTRLLAFGEVADANGFITIDAGGHSMEFVLFTEEIFKNGWIRRRVAECTVKTAKVDKSERGSVNGTAMEFAARRSASLENKHIGEWLIAPTP